MQDYERYQRQIILPEIGEEGQKRLLASSVLIIGVGGLGSPASLYLAAAGVGKIGLVDFDKVDISNLHRQIIHNETTLEMPKTASATRHLEAVNSATQLVPFETRFASEQVAEFDVVLDCSDNLATKYQASDACCRYGKPLVHASVFQWQGFATTFPAGGKPCYRCLHPQEPMLGAEANCADAGVIGPVAGILGCIQAAEAIKLICGAGEPLYRRLLQIDGLNFETQMLRYEANRDCDVCAKKMISDMAEVSVQYLRDKRQSNEDFMLLDVRDADELEISRLDPCTHVPVHEVVRKMKSWDKEQEILVLCRTGNRSANITAVLRQAGFANAKNVAGGINAYAREIDPELSEY